jgi:FkbM family methyltransferase
MSLRTRLIQIMIDVNERIVFYPALRKFYTAALKGKAIKVIDVGSNKGQSIEFFKSITDQIEIYGFEPNKKLFTKLADKYKTFKNIHLFNLGISSTNGKLVFHENVLDETSTFEQLNFDSEYLIKKAKILGVKKDQLIVDSYEVNVTTLDDFLKKHPNVLFDVLKIDVEGHELQALKGLFTGTLKNHPVRFIQLESHNDDMYLHKSAADIIGLLTENGFHEVAKLKHGFGDFFEIIYENKTNS